MLDFSHDPERKKSTQLLVLGIILFPKRLNGAVCRVTASAEDMKNTLVLPHAFGGFNVGMTLPYFNISHRTERVSLLGVENTSPDSRRQRGCSPCDPIHPDKGVKEQEGSQEPQNVP